MNKLIARAGFLLAMALAVVLIVGCNTTQSPERQVDDSAITAQVKAKLAADIELSTLTGIEVETSNGVVTLAGQVDTTAAKMRAEEITQSIEGVVRVTNNIRVAGA